MVMTRELVSVRPPESVTVSEHVTELASPVPSRLYTDCIVTLHDVDMLKYLQHIDGLHLVLLNDLGWRHLKCINKIRQVASALCN